MTYSTLPIAGIDLTQIFPSTAQVTVGPEGLQTFGSDGRLYVFGQVGSAASIASSALCNVNTTTFEITANTAGSYKFGPNSAAANSYVWVSKASV